MLSEAEFQSLVLEAVRRLGLQAYHTHDSRRSQPGFPDLVIVGDRGILFRELKTEVGVVSADQRYWVEILRGGGADVEVWRPNMWPNEIMFQLRKLGRLQVSAPIRAKSARIPRQRSS